MTTTNGKARILVSLALLAAGLLTQPGPAGAQLEYAADIITGTNMVRQLAPTGTNFLAGRTGIGTNAPAAKLHVVGDLRVDGPLIVPKQGDVSMGAYTNGVGDQGLVSNPGTYFEAWNSAAQTITVGGCTAVAFGTVERDYGNNFTASTYTTPSAGVYQFQAGVVLSGGNLGAWAAGVFRTNGVDWKAASSGLLGPAGYGGATGSAGGYLSSGTTVRFCVYNTDSRDWTTIGGSAYTWFSGGRVP